MDTLTKNCKAVGMGTLRWGTRGQLCEDTESNMLAHL